MSSARRQLMARPRPVPPKRRVVEASTWEKEWNSRSIASCGMPMPVSVTLNSSSMGWRGPSSTSGERESIFRSGTRQVARAGAGSHQWRGTGPGGHERRARIRSPALGGAEGGGGARGHPGLGGNGLGRFHAHGEHDFAALGELDGVAQQVDEDLAQARGVAADDLRHAVGDFIEQVEALLRGLGGQQVERALDAIAQHEGLAFQARGGPTRSWRSRGCR